MIRLSKSELYWKNVQITFPLNDCENHRFEQRRNNCLSVFTIVCCDECGNIGQEEGWLLTHYFNEDVCLLTHTNFVEHQHFKQEKVCRSQKSV